MSNQEIPGFSLRYKIQKLLSISLCSFIIVQLLVEINSQINEKGEKIVNEQSSLLEERIFLRINKTNHESEAINLLNEFIYKNFTLSSNDILELVTQRRWLKATKLVIDFLLSLEDQTKHEKLKKEMDLLLKKSYSQLDYLKNTLQKKKKNIIRISPVFEWSQDTEFIKIRLKFAKNLESPGEKDIQNFKLNCSRTHLAVHGYKVKEDYLTYYYRRIHLYDFMKYLTCEGYKETDGTYIIKFMKNQPTLYWNFLDQIGDDHHNTYTWFDVFEAYDDKAKYTSFREWAMENLYLSDIDDYVKDNMEEKNRRLNRIKNSLKYLKTKDYENKNFCNSPVNEKICIISDIHDWNYWLF